MKKSIKHTCLSCGNVYYYRNTKFKGKCLVCRGLLQPEGWKRATVGLGLTWTPDTPMPPVKPPRTDDKAEPTKNNVEFLYYCDPDKAKATCSQIRCKYLGYLGPHACEATAKREHALLFDGMPLVARAIHKCHAK